MDAIVSPLTHHIGHWSELLVSLRLPYLNVSSECNIVCPLDKVVVLQRLLAKRDISFSQSIDESGIVVSFIGG